jgi:hypothetical protein
MNNNIEINNDGDLEFFKIICKTCLKELTKKFTPTEHLIIFQDSHFIVKPYILKLVIYSTKTKMKNMMPLAYLFEEVKCVNCEEVIGRYIKTCTEHNFSAINHILLNQKHITM